jgi:hypothetical protein
MKLSDGHRPVAVDDAMERLRSDAWAAEAA